VQTIPFSEDVAPKKSYLNDVRIDTRTNTAFITESANGEIIVVDLKSGKARRSAAPVCQSDQGANAKSETATTLITIVASTTPRRPHSSEMPCASPAVGISI